MEAVKRDVSEWRELIASQAASGLSRLFGIPNNRLYSDFLIILTFFPKPCK